MRLKLKLLAILVVFLSGCCSDSDDVPVVAELNSWLPYPDGQIRQFTNSNQEKFSLTARVQDADYDVSPAKRSCSYTVDRRVLKLETANAGTVAIQVAIENRYLQFGDVSSLLNAEVVFDVQDNYNEGTNGPYNPFVFLPEVTLNGQTYRNVVHYDQTLAYDPKNLFEEYYFVQDKGLVAFKLKNNAEMFIAD